MMRHLRLDLAVSPIKRAAEGFTLIEILLALLIFAIIAIITTTGLSSILKAQEHTQINAKDFAKLQIAVILIQRDIQQMIDRPIANNRGERLPALIANQPDYFEFTRAGHLNPLMWARRSTLQRVAYQFQNGQLIRKFWQVLDRAPATAAQQQILLGGVESMRIRYLGQDNQSYDNWPPPIGNQLHTMPLPKGVDITLTLRRFGAVNRLILVPATNFSGN